MGDGSGLENRRAKALWVRLPLPPPLPTYISWLDKLVYTEKAGGSSPSVGTNHLGLVKSVSRVAWDDEIVGAEPASQTTLTSTLVA